MDPSQIPLYALIVLLAAIASVLWAWIRFALISPRRLRGSRGRLLHPDLEGIESAWKVSLPRSLLSVYREGGVAELTETEIAHPMRIVSRWYIAGFLPLTADDATE